jgi:uncharacterized membrane protein (DUF2068 family)
MQDTMMESPRRQRPLGVTIIAVILLIDGIVELLGAVIAFTAAHAVHTHVRNVLGVAGDVFANAIGVFALIVAILTLVVAYGLFTLKRWAFWTVVVVEVIAIIERILQFFQPNANTTSIILGLILPIIILAYMFLDGNVRRAFHVGV